tara:strand:+ start:820 stop:1653 length:834 start_codon:yes stop_codon:yes gene_type:complete
MLKVIEPGLYSSIQDNGRFGYRNIGVPHSGFMDQECANIANYILGNNETDSLIEITLKGPTLLFNDNYTISITGGDFNAILNNEKINMYNPVEVKLGDMLKFSHTKNGARCYLAVSGGIDIKKLLGSRSLYKSITESYYLRKGDEIKVLNKSNKKKLNQSKLTFNIDNYIYAFKGPEFSVLDQKSLNKLFKNEFEIGINNRMAYNLKDKIQTGVKSIISSPVLPGTIQLTPSGNIIILHRDCQTTGGYSRILQLDEKSLNNLSRFKLGEKIKFKLLN